MYQGSIQWGSSSPPPNFPQTFKLPPNDVACCEPYIALNCVSDDLKFKLFWGRTPRPPLVNRTLCTWLVVLFKCLCTCTCTCMNTRTMTGSTWNNNNNSYYWQWSYTCTCTCSYRGDVPQTDLFVYNVVSTNES